MKLNEFQITSETAEKVVWSLNEVAYDSEAKEFVKITNLRCPICAQGNKHPDVLNGRHPVRGVECATEPFEAIALRLITLNRGKVVIGFTYRQINPAFLKKTTHKMNELDIFTANPEGIHYSFIGRV